MDGISVLATLLQAPVGCGLRDCLSHTSPAPRERSRRASGEDVGDRVAPLHPHPRRFAPRLPPPQAAGDFTVPRCGKINKIIGLCGNTRQQSVTRNHRAGRRSYSSGRGQTCHAPPAWSNQRDGRHAADPALDPCHLAAHAQGADRLRRRGAAFRAGASASTCAPPSPATASSSAAPIWAATSRPASIAWWIPSSPPSWATSAGPRPASAP